MRYSHLFFFFACFQGIPLVLSAQQTPNPGSHCIPKPDTIDGQKVYRLANKLAEYPGGESKMMEFIQNNLNRSVCKAEENHQLVVTFVIDTTGKLRNACIYKGGSANGNGTENEVIRVFEAMPPWTPAILHDKKTCYRIVMPVQIELR